MPCLLVIAATSFSEASDWVNPAGGDWSLASNWSAGVPNNLTDAVFNLTGLPDPTFVTTLSADAQAANLLLGHGNLTLDLHGQRLDLTTLLATGQGGGGLLNLTNSSIAMSTLRVPTVNVRTGLSLDGVNLTADTLDATLGLLTLYNSRVTLNSLFKPRQESQSLRLTTTSSTLYSNSVLVNGPIASASRPVLAFNGASVAMTGQLGSDNHLIVGASGGKADVEVSGAGATFSTATGYGSLYVGYGGTGGTSSTNPVFTPGDGQLNVFAGGHAAAEEVDLGAYGGVATVTVDGLSSEIASRSRAFYVGTSRSSTAANRGGRGTLTLTNGGRAASAASMIVGNLGGTGSVTADGDSQVNVGGSLLIGRSRYAAADNLQADGTFNLTAGARATTGAVYVGLDGGTGRLAIDGATAGGRASKLAASGEIWAGYMLWAGSTYVSNGTVALTRGGQLTTDSFVHVGFYGGEGRLTVDGAGSSLSAPIGGIDIGINRVNSSLNGQGTVTVSNGGAIVTRGFTSIGLSGGVGHVTVSGVANGTASRLDNDSGIGIGINDPDGAGKTIGTLDVVSGGQVHSGLTTPSSAIVGSAFGQGRVTIGSATANSSSWTHGGRLLLGSDGTNIGSGTLNVNAGGVAGFSDRIQIFQTAATAADRDGGHLYVSGGTLKAAVSIEPSGTGGRDRFRFDNGTLRAEGDLAISMPMSLASGGAVIDSNSFAVTDSAPIDNASGASGGGLTKIGTGSLTLLAANTYRGPTVVKAGQLILSKPAQNAVLSETGWADLQGGSIVFDYAGSTSPIGGIRTEINSAAASGFTSGRFRSTDLPANRTLGYRDNGMGRVSVLLTLPGDADLNGQVDFNDFLVLQNSFGKAESTFGEGNFDYNGVTDFNDFLILQNYFGQNTVGSPVAITKSESEQMRSFAASVPEPAVVAIASGFPLTRRRRRRGVA